MGTFGRFTHRCTVCGKGQCFSTDSICHKAKVTTILALHRRRKCNHEFVRMRVKGVLRWPNMCIKCGGMGK